MQYYDTKQNGTCDFCKKQGMVHFMPSKAYDHEEEGAYCTKHAKEIRESRKQDGWMTFAIRREI